MKKKEFKSFSALNNYYDFIIKNTHNVVLNTNDDMNVINCCACLKNLNF